MAKTLTGRCLCGSVAFSVEDDFSAFYFCHCRQCQQITGSAHAANVFTAPTNIQWLQGADKLIRYDDPERSFTTQFCSQCGSGLPFVTKSGKALLIPAGSLDKEPESILPMSNIFSVEKASWLDTGTHAPCVDGFPE